MRSIPRPPGPRQILFTDKATIEQRIEICSICPYGSQRSVYYTGQYKANNGRKVSKCNYADTFLFTIVHMHKPHCPLDKWPT